MSRICVKDIRSALSGPTIGCSSLFISVTLFPFNLIYFSFDRSSSVNENAILDLITIPTSTIYAQIPASSHSLPATSYSGRLRGHIIKGSATSTQAAPPSVMMVAYQIYIHGDHLLLSYLFGIHHFWQFHVHII